MNAQTISTFFPEFNATDLKGTQPQRLQAIRNRLIDEAHWINGLLPASQNTNDAMTTLGHTWYSVNVAIRGESDHEAHREFRGGATGSTEQTAGAGR